MEVPVNAADKSSDGLIKVLAYGSLMQLESLVRSLGRPAELTPLTVIGYARTYNSPFSGLGYLNLVARTGSRIEAAYFELSGSELALFAEREAGSDLIEVTPGLFAFVWPPQLCEELPVPMSYIAFCALGAIQLGISLISGWLMPRTVMYDIPNPLYPDMGQ